MMQRQPGSQKEVFSSGFVTGSDTIFMKEIYVTGLNSFTKFAYNSKLEGRVTGESDRPQ